MKRPTFFLLVCFLTPSTLSLETGRAGFGGGPVLLRLSHSLGRAEAPPWRDERRKPHLTSPPKPWRMPPLAPPGPVGTHRGDAMMPGHGAAHRSGKSLLGTAWRIPSPSFLDELVRGRWWWRGGQGQARDATDPRGWVSPQGSTARPHPSEAPAGIPSCDPRTSPIFLALRSGRWASFHTFLWQSKKAPGVRQQPESISAGLVPCSPFPPSASSSLSSRFTSSPVLPGKARVVLNLQLLYSIK